MSDPGTRKADASQAEIEKRLRTVYEAAARDIIQRLDKHQKRLIAEDAEKRRQVEAGELSEEDYRKWLSGQAFRGKTWQDQVKDLTNVLLDANRQALNIVNGERISVFTENANYQAYSLEKGAGMDLGFTLYDKAAVTRLIRNQPGLLPAKSINAGKDTAWNRKNIASVIARGILSGESVQDIAKRLGEALVNTNEKAMLRYARTAMTAAQNAGRMEVLDDAVHMGIRVKKQWLATLDERTRDAHAYLDGQKQDVDHPFSSPLGPIMYPGDPTADPANTWNCRCTLVYDYEEYPSEGGTRYDQESGELIEDMTYQEWKAWAAE